MAEYALFGNVGLKRAFCRACDGNALIVDDKFQCCDRVYSGRVGRTVRESQPEFKRRTPCKKDRLAILERQSNKCLYCELPFDSVVLRGNRTTRLTPRWDHLIPFNYSQDNCPENFVAACQVCNGIKGDKCFDTITDARDHIRARRAQKGYFPS